MSEKGYLFPGAAKGAARVRIAEDVVRGITQEAMRGLGVTRRRGAEAGGLLLGTPARGDDPIVVEAFRPVPCQYAFGPSYVLSEEDAVGFAKGVHEGGASVVGFYRSHTRDGLTTQEDDEVLWAKHLSHVAKGVVLLVKPFATKTPLARVISVENGKFRSTSGNAEDSAFPFSNAAAERTESAAAAPEARPSRAVLLPTKEQPASVVPSSAGDNSSQAAPVVSEAPSQGRPSARASSSTSEPGVKPASTKRADEAASRKIEPPRFGVKLDSDHQDETKTTFLPLIAAVLAALAFGLAVGYQYGRGTLPWSTAPQPVSDPYRLGLRAVQAGDGVRLEWQRESAVANVAQRARVHLNSAEGTQTLYIERREFLRGTLVVKPANPITSIRLEADLGDSRTITENIPWSGGPDPKLPSE